MIITMTKYPNTEMNYVEAWFDNHPEPYNIDMHLFEIGDKIIEVYFADQVFNTWMIKITCKTATAAVKLHKLLYKTTCQMDIHQYLKNRKLFLFTDLRF